MGLPKTVNLKARRTSRTAYDTIALVGCRKSSRILDRWLWAYHLGDAFPSHGSSPPPFVCGGAQRGISLARGFFTG